MFLMKKYENTNAKVNISTNAASDMGAVVGFSIFQLFCVKD